MLNNLQLIPEELSFPWCVYPDILTLLFGPLETTGHHHSVCQFCKTFRVAEARSFPHSGPLQVPSELDLHCKRILACEDYPTGEIKC